MKKSVTSFLNPGSAALNPFVCIGSRLESPCLGQQWVYRGVFGLVYDTSAGHSCQHSKISTVLSAHVLTFAFGFVGTFGEWDNFRNTRLTGVMPIRLHWLDNVE